MKERLKVLLLGTDNAKIRPLAIKLRKSPRLEHLYVASGDEDPWSETHGVNPTDVESVRNFVSENGIDMIIPTDKRSIAEGFADSFAESTAKVTSPLSAGSKLWIDREFVKEFLYRHAIPTARFMPVTADTLDEGMSYLESMEPPYVLKRSNSLTGDSVRIVHSLADAKDMLAAMVEEMPEDSNRYVLIEEFLEGEELRIMLAIDGEDYKLLSVIGAVIDKVTGTPLSLHGPVPDADGSLEARLEKQVIRPIIKGITDEALPYSGFMAITVKMINGDPFVVEFNIRPDAQESEVMLGAMESDIIDLLEGIVDSTLAVKKIALSTDPVESSYINPTDTADASE